MFKEAGNTQTLESECLESPLFLMTSTDYSAYWSLISWLCKMELIIEVFWVCREDELRLHECKEDLLVPGVLVDAWYLLASITMIIICSGYRIFEIPLQVYLTPEAMFLTIMSWHTFCHQVTAVETP